MGDNKRWFKVWNSILVDPTFERLPEEALSRWVRLGCVISLHGKGGSVTVHPDVLEKHCRCKIDALKTLPNIVFEEGKNRYDEVTVTYKNWYSYQVDTTAAERMKSLRSKRRREEKREEQEKNIPPISPQGDFDVFWKAYPRKVGKDAAKRKWESLRKINLLPPLDKILAAIEKQKQLEQWKRDFPQYVPHPATWLHQGRWEDEVQASSWHDKVREAT